MAKSEPDLRDEVINGKKAVVGYLKEMGGPLVEPKDAKIALVVYEDGSRELLNLENRGKK